MAAESETPDFSALSEFSVATGAGVLGVRLRRLLRNDALPLASLDRRQFTANTGCGLGTRGDHVIISIDFTRLRKTHWYEYAIRFVFGGLITVATGLIANHYGAKVGGLFLAFPAIFPASATLVEKHEAESKKRRGLNGIVRGREAAALDALGAAIGGIGLIAFAAVVWQLLRSCSAGIVLGGATAAWLGMAGLGWKIRRRPKHARR